MQIAGQLAVVLLGKHGAVAFVVEAVNLDAVEAGELGELLGERLAELGFGLDFAERGNEVRNDAVHHFRGDETLLDFELDHTLRTEAVRDDRERFTMDAEGAKIRDQAFARVRRAVAMKLDGAEDFAVEQVLHAGAENELERATEEAFGVVAGDGNALELGVREQEKSMLLNASGDVNGFDGAILLCDKRALIELLQTASAVRGQNCFPRRANRFKCQKL